MKGFLAILALATCVSAEVWTIRSGKQVEDIHLKCAKIHSLSPEQISKVRKLEFDDDVKAVRKYFECTCEIDPKFGVNHGNYASHLVKQYMNMKEQAKSDPSKNKWVSFLRSKMLVASQVSLCAYVRILKML